MALEASGYPPTLIAGLPSGKQPEDFLTELGETNEAIEVMRGRCPWFFDASGNPTVRPAEAPVMLDWIVEKAYGRPLLRYVETITFATILEQIDGGKAVVLRGVFTAEGHIVAGVGYTLGDPLGIAGTPPALLSIRVKDPWGNYLTGYKDHNGDNVDVPREALVEVLRPVGTLPKIGHLVL